MKLLCVKLDGNLNSMTRLRTCAERRFFHIRALRHIRTSLTEEIANVVACTLVQSRVDYAYSLYTGMPSVNFDKLQLVQNTLARVVTLTRKRDQIQSSLETTLATDPSTCRFQGCTVDLFHFSFW